MCYQWRDVPAQPAGCGQQQLKYGDACVDVQVRSAVWSAAVRDDDTQRDVHADRQQQIQHPAPRLHVGPWPHQLSPNTGTERTTFARSDRRLWLLHRRTHADLSRPVHLSYAAQVPRTNFQPFQVTPPVRACFYTWCVNLQYTFSFGRCENVVLIYFAAIQMVTVGPSLDFIFFYFYFYRCYLSLCKTFSHFCSWVTRFCRAVELTAMLVPRERHRTNCCVCFFCSCKSIDNSVWCTVIKKS